MPSLIDIFNPSFFIFLGILVLVVALLVVYFESKMREQNHKITSMFSLVSSMADELNNLKHSISLIGGVQPQQQPPQPPQHNDEKNITIKQTALIPVSDEEDNDDDDENDSIISSSSGQCSSEEEEEDEEENDDNEIIEIGTNNVKVLKVESFSIENEINDINEIDEITQLELVEDDDEESSSSSDDDDDIKDKEKALEFSFKSINITSSLEEESDSKPEDYKKLSIGRLRKIVLDKGLTEDSSKLNKKELLKLLESSILE